MTAQDILEKLARIDVDGRSAEHVANLACQYAADARTFLEKVRNTDFSTPPCHKCGAQLDETDDSYHCPRCHACGRDALGK